MHKQFAVDVVSFCETRLLPQEPWITENLRTMFKESVLFSRKPCLPFKTNDNQKRKMKQTKFRQKCRAINWMHLIAVQQTFDIEPMNGHSIGYIQWMPYVLTMKVIVHEIVIIKLLFFSLWITKMNSVKSVYLNQWFHSCFWTKSSLAEWW